MHLTRLDRTVSFMVIALVLAIAIVIWRGDQVGVSILRALPAAGSQAAVSSPVIIEFAQRMDVAGVESNFEIEPEIEGRFIWRENTMFFLPQEAWEHQTTYTVHLRTGVEDQLGHQLAEDFAWTFATREPGIVFLRDDGFGYALWTVQDLAEPRQITQVGNVFEYSVSPNGEQIAFSVANTENGIDLWRVNRNGEEEKLLLDCGPDRCFALDWSIDERVAYTRVHAPITPADPYSAPRIWLLDPTTGESLRLHADNQKIGYGPTWSPDGQRIAYFDGIQNRIVILDLRNGEEIYLPSSVGVLGSWAKDGSEMIYYDTQILEGQTAEVIFRADFDTQDILPFFDPQPKEGNYSSPLISPDGNWVAMRVRTAEGGPGDEIWITPIDGRYGTAITDQAGFLLTNLGWDPWSRSLVFSSIQLGVANPIPEVWLWDMETAELRLIAVNADAPAWLP